jgi:hypothetical protein
MAMSPDPLVIGVADSVQTLISLEYRKIVQAAIEHEHEDEAILDGSYTGLLLSELSKLLDVRFVIAKKTREVLLAQIAAVRCVFTSTNIEAEDIEADNTCSRWILRGGIAADTSHTGMLKVLQACLKYDSEAIRKAKGVSKHTNMFDAVMSKAGKELPSAFVKLLKSKLDEDIKRVG